jgi:amino-acid N-acetyltransferase
MKIRTARSDDLDAVKALLAQNELPVAEVDAALLEDFLVAEDARGKIVGSVGLERFGQSALLRSLCVARQVRNIGFGTTLLSHAEEMARSAGVSELWLLTTSAAGFIRSMEYVEADRSSAPAEVGQSPQFAQLCPASASCLKKQF